MQAIAEVEISEPQLCTEPSVEEAQKPKRAAKVVLAIVLGAILVLLGIVLGRVASHQPVSDHISDWI